jgi:hypothetical protein
MLPSEAESVYRILSSISFSCLRLAALVTIRACRSSSSSGLRKKMGKQFILHSNKIQLQFKRHIFFQHVPITFPPPLPQLPPNTMRFLTKVS